MIPLPLTDILKTVKGTLISGSGYPVINHIATEFSQINSTKNTLFFHLNSQYNLQFLKHCNNLVIVTETTAGANRNQLLVKVSDVKKAYWELVNYYRNLFNIPVFGITGTSGKTTVKEMITHILTMEGLNVQSTFKSNNDANSNLLYFLGMNKKTDAAVIEMAVAKPGDITRACRIFQPNIRVVLNIGVYHLEGCQTLENYIQAKAEIMNGIKPDDVLIVNADDQNSKKINSSLGNQKIHFGITEKADFMATDIQYAEEGISFSLACRNNEYAVWIPGYGKHNVYNALASIAAVYQMGIGINKAINHLSRFHHLESHLQACNGINGSSFIDDTWNNTPPAMAGALDVLKEISNGKKKIAVLGSFPRIGDSETAQKQYMDIAKKVIETEIDTLIIADKNADEIAKTAIMLGMKQEEVHYCFRDQEVLNTMKPLLNSETIILLKFSKIRMNSLFKSIQRGLLDSGRV